MAPRTEKPEPSKRSAEAQGKAQDRRGTVGETAVADSDPVSALGQSDPVPPRAQGSGTPPWTDPSAPADGERKIANPDPENPLNFEGQDQGDPRMDPNKLFLPNQALVAPESLSNGDDVAMIATVNQPYGSEPRNFDPETGKFEQPPPQPDKAEEVERG